MGRPQTINIKQVKRVERNGKWNRIEQLFTARSTLHSLFSTLLYTLPTPLTLRPIRSYQCPFANRNARSHSHSVLPALHVPRRGEWTQGDAVVVVAVAAGVAAAVSVSQLNLRAKNVPLFCRS